MKRRKKVVITDQELTPIVLATIESKKTGVGLIGIILLFAIFGSFTYYLPTISKYVESYLHPELKSNLAENEGEENNNEEEEVKKYLYTRTLSIDVDEFLLYKFTIDNDTLNFFLKNKKETTLNIDEFNYFLEIYDEKDNLLQQIKFEDVPTLSVNEETKVSYKLKNTNLNYFKFLEIKKESYPSYEAPLNEEKNGILTCTKDNEEIKYIFKNNKLNLVNLNLKLDMTTPDFFNQYETYQKIAETYNKMEGITAEFLSLEEGTMLFNTEIDLGKNNGTSLSLSKSVYAKDTDAKVIYFEMPLKNYICK